VWCDGTGLFDDCGVFTFKKADLPWEQRADMYASSVASLTRLYQTELVVCEYPAYFDTVAGNMVAKKGDLLKLTYLVGLIAGRVHPVPFRLVPVNAWKGQLPKEVVIGRLEKLYADTQCAGKLNSHSYDACGIGLHVKGLF
jgi:hypothetical protein